MPPGQDPASTQAPPPPDPNPKQNPPHDPPNRIYPQSGKRNHLFYVGEPVTFTLGGAAVSYEVCDYWGNQIDTGPAAASVTMKVDQPGWYKLYVYGAANQPPFGDSVGGTMFAIVRNKAGFPQRSSSSADGSDPLMDETLRGLGGLGPQRHKIDDFTNLAATQSRMDSDTSIDQANYLPFDPARPRSLFALFPNGTGDASFITALAKHFSGVISYWEGRHEPSSSNAVSAGTYIANELKPFHDAIKDASPNLKVMGPAIVTIGPGPAGLGFVDDFFRLGGSQYIDAFSFHGYNNFNGDLFLAR